ncbi:MAG: carboxypeptidase-like regulatory domain-containing protein [Thermoguttaceae bacterium]
MIAHALLLIAALPGLPNNPGTIRGTVVNASAATSSPCQATVVLRVYSGGQLVPLSETQSDARGQFRFDRLPIGVIYSYAVGASRDGVHYPGPRIVLTDEQPEAAVQLSVCDAVTGPNPLVIRRLEIAIVPEPGSLAVTESMLVENPSTTCYVGEPPPEGGEPATLALGIPSDFERTTFQDEFHGRRFSLAGGRVVTSIPWPPGRREIKYTYVLRNNQAYRCWERPLDLPCSQVRVRVRTPLGGEVRSNLPWLPADRDGEILFESDGQTMPAGYVLRVELGRLPLVWMDYARPLAVVTLLGLIAGTSCVLVWRRRKPAANL